MLCYFVDFIGVILWILSMCESFTNSTQSPLGLTPFMSDLTRFTRFGSDSLEFTYQ